ncbi:alpha/beta hydrolase fold protein [Cellulophaga algicola DSM 14237]|uniref:Alpha/beta hydrolase fold protein n=1 Tax=Cellulophaga algicola (strain DSM 14237 / IC166 / ACAM 630) TaxID=688270 RepID=E6X777_CELAD|nr:alpha/beta fold hydrolase [Cellulophaga algicola]ADV48530.1 alpha/beta hydrolase fold protein [Cellulophaga algicola DSM 14237]
MPLVASTYNPPILFKNGHLSTIYSGIFRKVDGVAQERERITLFDTDFLDLDWSFASQKSNKVMIILHGLEGSAQRPYIMGSAKVFNQNGYDACAINLRSCSGAPNLLFRSYHSGATEDLDAVIQHILTNKSYDEIYIKGFSLGGNLALKYLGEKREIPKAVKGAVAVSVPCDLYSSLKQLLLPKNRLYAARFKKHLVEKLRVKQELFPNEISDKDIASIKTLKDLDDIYTSRAHGFTDAIDYYTKSSCLPFLPNIKIPTLIINSKNDSFLGPECYPYTEAEENKNLFLETPNFGGHVGFYGVKNTTYTEKRCLNFLNEL